MVEKTVTVKARVMVTLMVDVSDCWGGDCPVSQVNKQARDSALATISRAVAHTNAQITGTPVVTAVVVESDAR